MLGLILISITIIILFVITRIMYDITVGNWIIKKKKGK